MWFYRGRQLARTLDHPANNHAPLADAAAPEYFRRYMSSVQSLFSEPWGPTVVSCDWCGELAIVCTMAERQVGGPPTRIGLCEEHHGRLSQSPGDTREAERADYERRRGQREADIRRQRSAWQVRKAARQAGARARANGAIQAPQPSRSAEGTGRERPNHNGTPAGERPFPQDSEELVASVLQGERMVAPVGSVDPRLEDTRETLERLQEALWPLVRLAEECGIYIDCNPSQKHSVLVVGEVPVDALFKARDLLKRER